MSIIQLHELNNLSQNYTFFPFLFLDYILLGWQIDFYASQLIKVVVLETIPVENCCVIIQRYTWLISFCMWRLKCVTAR